MTEYYQPYEVLPSKQSPLPPEHPERVSLTLKEVPGYLKRVHGVTVGVQTVRKWIRKGVKRKPHGPESDRIFLVSHRVPGQTRIIVRVDDLEAFMDGDTQ